MQAVVMAVVTSMASVVRSRMALQIEILALRHQLAVYHRAGHRPQLQPVDRLLWAWLARRWSAWREALVIVQPRTVISWQRKRFREHWARLSHHGKRGRPPVAKEIRELIRQLSAANPTWGSPRIMGELGKLGIAVAKSTVEKYRVRRSTPPSPTWRTFLATHAKDLVSVDFFTVATVRFEVLFVLLIFAHDRRRVLHCNVTAHPSAAWTAQQVVEAFPWETAPRYLLRDRDGVYGVDFRGRVAALGIEEVLTAPRSPWQSPYVERMIGSIRRECLDNVVVLHERHLRRLLTAYFAHYHSWRCHQALAMDCPQPRLIQGREQGAVIEVVEGGGLYRHYERRAA
jgi:transposase InsO family protein